MSAILLAKRPIPT